MVTEFVLCEQAAKLDLLQNSYIEGAFPIKLVDHIAIDFLPTHRVIHKRPC